MAISDSDLDRLYKDSPVLVTEIREIRAQLDDAIKTLRLAEMEMSAMAEDLGFDPEDPRTRDDFEVLLEMRETLTLAALREGVRNAPSE